MSGLTILRVPLLVGGALIVLALGYAVVVGFIDGDWQHVWDVLVGVESPFDRRPDLYLGISVIGYATLPIGIALTVSAAVEHYVASRLQSEEQAEAKIRKRMADAGE